MSKKTEQLFEKLTTEIAELKNVVITQTEQIAQLKKQIDAVSLVKIEENGENKTENFGNLILDEIVALKEKLSTLINDRLSEANTLCGGSNEFSLAELKQELVKLADMMTI